MATATASTATLRQDAATVLVVGAEPGAAWLGALAGLGPHRIEYLPDAAGRWTRAELADVGCVVLDIGDAGHHELERLLLPCRAAPHTPVVVVADQANEALALLAARHGAHDFVAKDALGDGGRLQNVLRFALARCAGQAARGAVEVPYRAAFASAPAGMAILGPDGRVLDANAAMCRLLGLRKDELVGVAYAVALAASTGTGAAGFDPDALPATLRFRSGDGALRRARLAASPVEARGEAGYVVTLEDVTDAFEAQRLLEESLAENERRLAYEVAIAECSNVLLRAESNEDLDPALLALRKAAKGTSIFVEMNVDDPELGLCTRLVHEVSEPDVVIDFDFWDLMPWARLPESYAALSKGEMFTMNVRELGPVERKAYVGVDVRAEANAPIFVRGRWAGLVGLADRDRDRKWSDSELRLLRTAARMISAFWEKQDVLASLETAVAAAERRIRHEHALFEASQALLSTDERALPAAMDALLNVTVATETFLERNVEDPVLGPCSEYVCGSVLTEDGKVVYEVDEYWRLVPWSRMPDSYIRLSRGEPFAFTLDDLGPTERAVYEESTWPMGSEINIPIFVDGRWRGLIGFANRAVERDWDETEIHLLQTAADMIGAYWSRQDAHARMRELVRSKDEFLASVSHELRTPLTTVVGLSAELRDRPHDFDPEEARELLALIADESTEMANLIADLLVAAREEVDNVTVHPEAVAVSEEVRSVVKALPHRKQVRIDVIRDVKAWADPVRARQVIRNLFTNALRYGGDEIRFEIDRRGGDAVVRTVDDGETIPPADRGRIFDPYHRAHTSPSQPGSVGLGLTVARRLARLMKGDLVYRAERGNVFELTLPAAG